jgi:hypothetical protein
MIKTKKQRAEEESAIQSIYQRESHNKAFAKPKTICVYILEGEDFYRWNELDMCPRNPTMMNKAELSLLLKNTPKSLKRDADSLIVYGKGDMFGHWSEYPKNHWYKEVK